MATTTPASSARTRHWSDFVAILVGVSMIGLALRPGDHNASNAAAQDLGNLNWILVVHIAAGAMALASVFLAQRRARTGLPKVLLMVAGALLLGGFILSIMAGDSGARSWLTLLLPGVLLLVAAFGVGPMPRHLDTRDG